MYSCTRSLYLEDRCKIQIYVKTHHILWWHSYVIKTPPQLGRISWKIYDTLKGISVMIWDRTDVIKDVSDSTPIPYVDYSTGCGFILSWPCVPPPNVRSDIWDCVESCTLHMFLAHRLRIVFTPKVKLIWPGKSCTCGSHFSHRKHHSPFQDPISSKTLRRNPYSC